MTDREMLELAAKAAGVELRWHPDGTAFSAVRCSGYWGVWNPLADDGDALRLAAELSMRIDICMNVGCAARYGVDLENVIYVGVGSDSDTLNATRRAIVRAAAQIGAQM